MTILIMACLWLTCSIPAAIILGKGMKEMGE